MKISVILAAALALGSTAWAQQETPHQQSTRAVQPTSQPSFGQRTSEAIKRMEAGAKRLWNRVTQKADDSAAAQGPRNDTRTMGAAPSGSQGVQDNSDRRARMDEAYRNYQQKPQR